MDLEAIQSVEINKDPFLMQRQKCSLGGGWMVIYFCSLGGTREVWMANSHRFPNCVGFSPFTQLRLSKKKQETSLSAEEVAENTSQFSHYSDMNSRRLNILQQHPPAQPPFVDTIICNFSKSGPVIQIGRIIALRERDISPLIEGR
ncbi:hypothetical protein TNCV_540591 [Trichonephila clavipes]|nr:hypothetical protein TNCV_540591 [Trichonephila clavipes]